MGCPKTFFDFNTCYIRLSEITMISREDSHLVVRMKDGCFVKHRDYNGSASKIEVRLLDAIRAVEG